MVIEPRTMRLIGIYKIALGVVCSRVYLEIKMGPQGLRTKELKVGWKELKRYIVRSEITSLEAKASELIDLIGHILCELYSKYTLYLPD